MKHRTFYVLLIIALFAVVSLGGCGGSSNNSPGTPENVGNYEPDPTEPTMLNVVGTRKFYAMVDELKADGTWAKAMASENNLYFFCSGVYYTSSDIARIEQSIPEGERAEFYMMAEQLKVELLEHYVSGDIIMLFEPTAEDINKFRIFLGTVSQDFREIAPSGELEMYAMARRLDSTGRELIFTYAVTHRTDILSSDESVLSLQSTQSVYEELGDALSQDTEYVTSPEYDEIDFQVGRWQRFYQWEAALADMAADNEALASAYEASAAADNNIAKIAAAQTSTFDFSYYNDAVKGFVLDGKSYEQLNFKLNRTNIVTYRVFTVYSFTNQKDYYFVQCNVSTTPKNYKDTTVHIDTGEGDGFTINFLYGYTRRVAIEHYIDSGTMSVSDVALLDNEPKNINKDTTYKAGVEKELSGKIGVNKDGVTAEIGGSLKYSNETSWTTKEYEVRNECENLYRASAAWYVNMTLPYDSGKYVDSHFLFLNYAVHWGIKFYDASIRQLEFPCEWIWEVGKDYWKNHATINLNGKFTIHDGLSIGRTDNGETVYNRADHYRERTGKISMTLNQPPHVAATKRLFPVTSKGATANYFSLLSEDDWTITDIPSWIHLAQSSGNATGGAETLVLFDVDANTTGAPRKGTFTVKSGRDTLTIEVAQSGN